jgi:transposase
VRVPAEILYERMKAAVLNEVDDQGIAYNHKLLDLAAHYRFLPKPCRPYRAKTKGKVERPFRYVREDSFLGRDPVPYETQAPPRSCAGRASAN